MSIDIPCPVLQGGKERFETQVIQDGGLKNKQYKMVA